MEIIKFDRIVSVNSEIQNHGATLLLEARVGLDKSWLCEKGTTKAIAILKLERSSVPVKVDIGNANSAFIEVHVGRASDPSDNFQVLIPTSTFMSPVESKTGQNKNQVRFFTAKDFDPDATGKQWDLLKVVCSQPFDKHTPYGICFITLYVEKTKTASFLKEPDAADLSVGSFFRKRKEGGDEKGKIQSISERIRESEKPSALASHVPLAATKITTKPAKESGESSSKRQKITDNEATPGKHSTSIVDSPKASSSSRDRKEDKTKQQESEKKERSKERTPSRHASSENPKRKLEEKAKDKEYRRKEKDTSQARRKRKPFEKLLEDVVFVLSGYQNPERATYRSHALAMGAQYKSDWKDGECTHLVAAYINTPKCNQVKGKGKIVGKDWVEKCYSDKKRYPWRRFALDKNDRRQPESEEEIDVGSESPSRVEPSTSKQANVNERRPRFDDNDSGSDAYNASTDNDDVDDDENDHEQKSSQLPSLPDFFQGLSFYVDDSISDRSVLERYIIAYNGVVEDKVDKVDYLVTFQRGSALQNLKGHGNNVRAVSPTWIQSVNCMKKFIPATSFLID